ncbi:MAG: YlxM family DNA-binding protein [Clostridia bacterium]
MIEHTIRINYLLDFYKMLLTDKQKFALEMYYQEDLSLVEIAQNLDVSRQAIYDLLKRGEGILEEYEEKLQLYSKYINRQEKADKIIEFISENIERNETKEKLIIRIQKLVD